MKMDPNWWRGAVVYQVYPRSFQDDSGDGIGDLAGITRRLPHIKSLGVDAVWLSPIFPSPMADMGYDVSDYTDIEPTFGTLQDFERLIEAAHGMGLKVIIDQVLSHTSIAHPWFTESRADKTNPKADWYVWADPKPNGAPPNDWPSVFGGSAWTWDARRRQYYLHNFLDLQPDLNFHNAEVQDAVLDVLRFWLERGVDGFRLDTVNYFTHDKQLRENPAKPWPKNDLPSNPYEMQIHTYSKSRPENVEFLKRVRKLTDEYAGRTLVGEVGDSDFAIELMGEYTSGGDKLHMAYSFDMLSPDFSVAHFRRTIEGFWKGAKGGWPMWSMSNHDVIRHVTRWANYEAAPDQIAKLAITMLCAFEGTLCLYQGEELGLTETDLDYSELTDPVGLRFWPENKGRDGCRTPMVWDETTQAGFTTGKPWLPIKPAQAARAVSVQEALAGSVLSHYRAVLAWRAQEPLLKSGRQIFHEAPDPVLHFTREADGKRLHCLFNLSPKAVSLPLEVKGNLIGPDVSGVPQACYEDGTVHIPANGWAFIAQGEG